VEGKQSLASVGLRHKLATDGHRVTNADHPLGRKTGGPTRTKVKNRSQAPKRNVVDSLLASHLPELEWTRAEINNSRSSMSGKGGALLLTVCVPSEILIKLDCFNVVNSVTTPVTVIWWRRGKGSAHGSIRIMFPSSLKALPPTVRMPGHSVRVSASSRL
jgi:hypothetical protein